MMDVYTQAELDAALRDPIGETIVCRGHSEVRIWGRASVSAADQASVHAAGQASVRAWGQASVYAADQASVRAADQASVRAAGQASVYAGKWVTVRASAGIPVTGGIRIPPITTAADWCAFYGADVDETSGLIVLYKAVDPRFRSPHGTDYTPGSTPSAQDWDGGTREYGGGLHFCAHPLDALRFAPEARHYVACPVRLDEIVVHPDAEYPEKVRAPRVAAPCWEVDMHGRPISTAPAASHPEVA